MRARPAVDTQAYHAAIGHVAMEWSALENSVHRLAWCLAGVDTNIGRCMTQHTAFGTVWDSILAMSVERKLPAARQQKLRALQSQSEPLRLKRNEVVHALWGIASGEDLAKGQLTAVVVKARGKLKIDLYNYSIEFMHELAAKISNLSLAIAEQAILSPNAPAA